MTDQDLIAQFDNWIEYEVLLVTAGELLPMRDRIEELMKERDDYKDLYYAAFKDAASLNIHYAEVGYKAKTAEAKLAKAVEALQYADKMVRLVLIYMTDWDNKDFSQAVFDTEKQIATTLAELEGK